MHVAQGLGRSLQCSVSAESRQCLESDFPLTQHGSRCARSDDEDDHMAVIMRLVYDFSTGKSAAICCRFTQMFAIAPPELQPVKLPLKRSGTAGADVAPKPCRGVPILLTPKVTV